MHARPSSRITACRDASVQRSRYIRLPLRGNSNLCAVIISGVVITSSLCHIEPLPMVAGVFSSMLCPLLFSITMLACFCKCVHALMSARPRVLCPLLLSIPMLACSVCCSCQGRRSLPIALVHPDARVLCLFLIAHCSCPSRLLLPIALVNPDARCSARLRATWEPRCASCRGWHQAG